MDNNTRQPPTSGPTSLKEILHDLHEAGQFKASILASADGLLIATVADEYDGDVMAAVVAMLRRVGAEAQEQLGMAEMDEITIHSHDRVRLVCRHIAADRENLVLVVVVPPGRCYRRVTNRAIRQLKRVLA